MQTGCDERERKPKQKGPVPYLKMEQSKHLLCAELGYDRLLSEVCGSARWQSIIECIPVVWGGLRVRHLLIDLLKFD